MIETCQNIFNIAASFFAASKVKAFCGSLLAVIYFAIGGNVESSLVLFALIMLDALMALIVVAKTDLRFSSTKMTRTLYKIGIYSILVVGAHQLDKVMNVPDLPVVPDAPVVWLVLSWASATQFLSILEHAAELGFSIPHKLFSRIRKITDDK